MHQLTLKPAQLKLGQYLERFLDHFVVMVVIFVRTSALLHVIADHSLAFPLLADEAMVARAGRDREAFRLGARSNQLDARRVHRVQIQVQLFHL